MIVRHEGLRALWTGRTPNIARNSVVNAAELATYDHIKSVLQASFGMSDNVYCHLSASVCAGFLAVAAGSPFDVVKSRAMGEPAGGVGGQCSVHLAGPLGQWGSVVGTGG